MKILTRYILREMLIPLIYCLVGFNMIFVIFDLFDNLNHLMDGRLAPWMVAAYYVCYITPYLEWIAPAALLLSVLYTMWRLSHNGEITAMRAGGIGFGRIAAPMLWVSIVIALTIALLNEFVSPVSGEWAKRLSDNRFHPPPPLIHEEVPYYNRSAMRIWLIDRIDAGNPSKLEGVRITFEREDRSRKKEISAQAAEYLDGEWWLFYPSFRFFDQDSQLLAEAGQKFPGRSLMRLPGLVERPADFVNELRDWRFFPLRDIRRYLQMNPGLPEQALAEKRYQFHYRIASPWAGVVITLFAIPAGVASGRQSVLKGILLALGLFFAFFALGQVCMFLGQKNLIAPWLGAWTPNAVFLGAGAIIFYRQR